MIDLSHELGVTTVAEGVENEETADRLRDYGCEFVQGFYCSPPVGAADIVDLIRGNKPCCPEDTAALGLSVGDFRAHRRIKLAGLSSRL